MSRTRRERRLACIVSTVCRTIVDRKSQTVFRTCKCTLETICIDDRFVRCSRATSMREPRSFLLVHRVLSRSNNIVKELVGQKFDSPLEKIESDQNYSNVRASRLFLLFKGL